MRLPSSVLPSQLPLSRMAGRSIPRQHRTLRRDILELFATRIHKNWARMPVSL